MPPRRQLHLTPAQRAKQVATQEVAVPKPAQEVAQASAFVSPIENLIALLPRLQLYPEEPCKIIFFHKDISTILDILQHIRDITIRYDTTHKEAPLFLIEEKDEHTQLQLYFFMSSFFDKSKYLEVEASCREPVDLAVEHLKIKKSIEFDKALRLKGRYLHKDDFEKYMQKTGLVSRAEKNEIREKFFLEGFNIYVLKKDSYSAFLSALVPEHEMVCAFSSLTFIPAQCGVSDIQHHDLKIEKQTISLEQFYEVVNHAVSHQCVDRINPAPLSKILQHLEHFLGMLGYYKARIIANTNVNYDSIFQTLSLFFRVEEAISQSIVSIEFNELTVISLKEIIYIFKLLKAGVKFTCWAGSDLFFKQVIKEIESLVDSIKNFQEERSLKSLEMLWDNLTILLKERNSFYIAEQTSSLKLKTAPRDRLLSRPTYRDANSQPVQSGCVPNHLRIYQAPTYGEKKRVSAINRRNINVRELGDDLSNIDLHDVKTLQRISQTRALGASWEDGDYKYYFDIGYDDEETVDGFTRARSQSAPPRFDIPNSGLNVSSSRSPSPLRQAPLNIIKDLNELLENFSSNPFFEIKSVNLNKLMGKIKGLFSFCQKNHALEAQHFHEFYGRLTDLIGFRFNLNGEQFQPDIFLNIAQGSPVLRASLEAMCYYNLRVQFFRAEISKPLFIQQLMNALSDIILQIELAEESNQTHELHSKLVDYVGSDATPCSIELLTAQGRPVSLNQSKHPIEPWCGPEYEFDFSADAEWDYHGSNDLHAPLKKHLYRLRKLRKLKFRVNPPVTEKDINLMSEREVKEEIAQIEDEFKTAVGREFQALVPADPGMYNSLQASSIQEHRAQFSPIHGESPTPSSSSSSRSLSPLRQEPLNIIKDLNELLVGLSNPFSGVTINSINFNKLVGKLNGLFTFCQKNHTLETQHAHEFYGRLTDLIGFRFNLNGDQFQPDTYLKIALNAPVLRASLEAMCYYNLGVQFFLPERSRPLFIQRLMNALSDLICQIELTQLNQPCELLSKLTQYLGSEKTPCSIELLTAQGRPVSLNQSKPHIEPWSDPEYEFDFSADAEWDYHDSNDLHAPLKKHLYRLRKLRKLKFRLGVNSAEKDINLMLEREVKEEIAQIEDEFKTAIGREFQALSKPGNASSPVPFSQQEYQARLSPIQGEAIKSRSATPSSSSSSRSPSPPPKWKPSAAVIPSSAWNSLGEPQKDPSPPPPPVDRGQKPSRFLPGQSPSASSRATSARAGSPPTARPLRFPEVQVIKRKSTETTMNMIMFLGTNDFIQHMPAAFKEADGRSIAFVVWIPSTESLTPSILRERLKSISKEQSAKVLFLSGNFDDEDVHRFSECYDPIKLSQLTDVEFPVNRNRELQVEMSTTKQNVIMYGRFLKAMRMAKATFEKKLREKPLFGKQRIPIALFKDSVEAKLKFNEETFFYNSPDIIVKISQLPSAK